MVDRGNCARFAPKPAHIASDHPLDCDGAIQAFIVRLVDFAHTSRADQRLDRVWAEPRAGSQEHVVASILSRAIALTSVRVSFVNMICLGGRQGFAPIREEPKAMREALSRGNSRCD